MYSDGDHRFVFWSPLLLILSSAEVYAQITLDGTVGPSGPLALDGPNFKIEAVMGEQAGANLFHSFGQFNIHQGESATFSGPDSIANIISRVTGGEISSIDGLLRSTIPQADLYLLNPAGILFGENAQLDVQGSFHASTADYLVLGEEGRFDVQAPDDPVLSMASPSAFGFLDANPAGITVESGDYDIDSDVATDGLTVPTEQTLSFVGGDITVDDSVLSAPGGRLQLVSMDSMGEVSVSDFENETPASGGEMTISSSLLDTSGNGAGGVVIRGGRLQLEDSYIYADTFGDQDGEAIDIRLQDDLTVRDAWIWASTSGSGDGGDIIVQAGEIDLDIKFEGSRGVYSFTEGEGRGGTITLNAADEIIIKGRNSGDDFSRGVFSETGGSGDSGRIIVSTPHLQVQEGGEIYVNSYGDGSLSDINIFADDIELIGGYIYANTSSGPSAGDVSNINIQTDNLRLSEGGKIGSFTYGTRHGNNITVDATESIRIEGASSIISVTKGDGNAGSIHISAQELEMQGGFIGSNTFSSANSGDITLTISNELSLYESSTINSETYSEGNAGEIFIDAGTLTMASGLIEANSVFPEDSSDIRLGDAGDITVRAGRINLFEGARLSSTTQGTGQGGNINVNATESILIEELDRNREVPTGIFADAKGSGKAGNIDVTTRNLTLQGGALGATASATTTADSGGGKIRVVVRNLLLLERYENGRAGGISTETFGKAGAGDIFIDAGALTMTGGLIVANSVFDEGSPDTLGDAGNITVQAGQVRLTDGAQISGITRGAGQGGTISINATDSLLIQGHSLNQWGEVVPSGFYATTEGSASGGNIALRANNITLLDNAVVTAASIGEGNAGSLDITAYDRLQSRSSTLITSAEQAAGGNITITAGNIELIQSPITASVSRGVGGGGNVTLNAESIAALENSDITAKADLGFGGNITINADDFLRAPDVDLDASSQVVGNEGNVDVNARDITTNLLITLPTSFLDASTQLSQRCGGMDSATRSSFIIQGRGGLPPGPDGPLTAVSSHCRPEVTAPSALKRRFALSPQPKRPVTGQRWDGSK